MPSQITVLGGNLFRIAADLLSDATQANRIADASGVTDFFIQTTTPLTLTVPDPDITQTGGVPTAS